MRKIMYTLTISLDGYAEDKHGRIDFTTPSEELHQHFNDRESNIAAHIYGRKLYEIMSAFWPTADQDPAAPAIITEYARIWRDKPKYVFSSTLDKVEWNSTLLRGGIAEEMSKLKQMPGEFMSVGGPELAADFIRLDLIDEYWLYMVPVLLGGGKSAFPTPGPQINLELMESRQFPGGTTMLRYQRPQAG